MLNAWATVRVIASAYWREEGGRREGGREGGRKRGKERGEREREKGRYTYP